MSMCQNTNRKEKEIYPQISYMHLEACKVRSMEIWRQYHQINRLDVLKRARERKSERAGKRKEKKWKSSQFDSFFFFVSLINVWGKYEFAFLIFYPSISIHFLFYILRARNGCKRHFKGNSVNIVVALLKLISRSCWQRCLINYLCCVSSARIISRFNIFGKFLYAFSQPPMLILHPFCLPTMCSYRSRVLW